MKRYPKKIGLLFVCASSVMLTLFFLLAVLGCGRRGYPACETDEECHEVNANETCVNAQCVECRDSSQCEEGYECIQNICEQQEVGCQDSIDCNTGEVCREGSCGPCTDSSECDEEGMSCHDGECVEGAEAEEGEATEEPSGDAGAAEGEEPAAEAPEK